MIDVKVCGIADDQTVLALAPMPVDFLGLIFVASSPRSVSIEKAKELCSLAREKKWIGVFVNESPEILSEHVEMLSLAGVQLHGDETIDDIRRVRSLIGDSVEIWKAVRIQSSEDCSALAQVAPHVNRILFDTKVPGGAYGGTGKKFDWTVLKNVSSDIPCVLSGGIHPEDGAMVRAVCQDIQSISVVDVNSHFEVSPGVKDAARVKQFIEELSYE